ncbi:MAG: c-type cytochrome, partial [Burkholderiales bacterium]
PLERCQTRVYPRTKRRKNMNRPVLIAMLAALMLAGCGKEAPPPPPPAPVKAPDAAPPPAAPAAKIATGGPAPGSATAIAALDDKKAQEIMDKAGCAACHAIDKKGVGPAYTDVAKKRKGEQGAAAMLVKKVRDGGIGAYGQIPMPPNPASKISDAELKAMIDWVLTK